MVSGFGRLRGSNEFTLLFSLFFVLLVTFPTEIHAFKHPCFKPFIKPVTFSSKLFTSQGKDDPKSMMDRISRQITSNDVSHVRVQSQVFPKGINRNLISIHETSQSSFAAIFRQSAPYIALHRGSIMVVHIPGFVLKNKRQFENIMDDISILHLLGIKLVVVVGVKDQLEQRLLAAGREVVYHMGMRVTDQETLQFLKEESGAARYEVESALARGIRGMVSAKSGINVVSGNLFYSAKPLGVRNAIDFKLTGEVRKVEVENFLRRLDSGDVVLLTSLGYSTSGEVYSVPSESLAAECAAQLKAAKVIYLTEGEGLTDVRTDKPVQSLRMSQAKEVLEAWGLGQSSYNYVESSDGHAPPQSPQSPATAVFEPTVAAFMRLLARSVHALSGGVKRAHLVPAYSGAILQELYTTDGAGMLICRDLYDGIRSAREEDLEALQAIIKPLEEQGVLAPRSRDDLLSELPNTFVMVRDNNTVACGMLKQFSPTHAEIACLAVHPNYRRGGRGETMLTYLEHRAVLQKITNIFVLSTHTMQWFEERGFRSADPSVLPPTRKYNPARNSKVYVKKLGSQRDLEAENLLWDIA